MSNYNEALQSNNVDLQEVLQALQNKAAGSGGGSPIEVWTGTISQIGMPILPPGVSSYATIHYTDESLNTQILEVTSLPATIRVAKNTIFYISSNVSMTPTSDIESLYAYGGKYVCLPISNDFALTVQG